ncbi:SAM-dependent methyltransferase [Micromonospora sp. CA-111912]|uniref:SAM-dependent methyltransferase n=1 Tax=Micromonospora sp. CA-111912 TaxID=3239955 RepID=UPI003D903F57
MSDSYRPDRESVGEMYDKITVLSEDMLGDSHHFGYFPDGVHEDVGMREAADNLTDLLIERLALRPGQRVLDLGCGTGRPAVRLAETVPVEVVGITISHAQVDIATERAAAAGVADRVRFELVDATSMPYDKNSFDAVLAIESLEHLPDQAGVLNAIAGILRPGGRLVVAQPVLQRVDDQERDDFVRQLYQNYHLAQPPYLDEYPQLFARAGLRTRYLEDIYEQVIPPTLAVVDAWVRANSERISALGDYEQEVLGLIDGMRTFAELPGVGFAVLVAGKE